MTSEPSQPDPAPQALPPASAAAATEDLWSRLKHHQVVQWTLAYMALAYTLLHGAEMLAGALGWPHALIRIFTLALLLGAPVVAIMAWYHGARGQQRVSAMEFAILALLLGVGGYYIWSSTAQHESPASMTAAGAQTATERQGAGDSATNNPAASRIAQQSIAVLPFADLSEKHDQEYFSDGLAEELLDLLAKVPGLQVIARTSSFSFKGKSVDIPTIAKRLNVANILEGSVRKAGSRLRITTQLVRADTGVHIWSETYDRDLSDIFKIQDEIAGAVVDKLKVTLLAGAPNAEAGTSNFEAHNLFLQGRFFMEKQTAADLQKAIESFQRASALDHDYAAPWEGLANAYIRQVANSYVDHDLGITRIREAANRAIKLNPRSGLAYGALSFIAMTDEYDWPKAGELADRAREFDPNDTTVLRQSAMLPRNRGHAEQSVAFFRQALELDPLNLQTRRYFARQLWFMGRFDEAEAVIRQLLDLNPEYPVAHYELGRILLSKGQIAAAMTAFQAETEPAWREFGLPLGYFAQGKIREAEAAQAVVISHSTGSEFQVAEGFAYLGNADKTFEWLDNAYKQHDPGLQWLIGNPLFAKLTGDPRYVALLRRVNLRQ